MSRAQRLKEMLRHFVKQAEANLNSYFFAPSLVSQQVRIKQKGVIGIVGLKPSEVARLNIAIVEMGNKMGLREDQDFPNMISIGIPARDVRTLENHVDVCLAYGSDVIIGAYKGSSSNLDERFRNLFRVPIISACDGGAKELAKRALDASFNIRNSQRLNTRFYGDNEEVMNENILKNKISTTKRLRQLEKIGVLGVFRKESFIGVLGGAGVMASADFSAMLAQRDTPFVHIEESSAPGKHMFEMGQGPTYVNHYVDACDFLKAVGADYLTIPCNTAHKRLSEYATLDVIDIRASVMDEYSDENGFILLGTNRTVGINLPDGGKGLYEEMRDNYPDQGPFYTPSELQQERIMKAIFDIKAGEIAGPKQEIISVVDELRSKYGPRLSVILGCTELGIVFSEVELASMNLIDPSEAMAEQAKKCIEIKRVENMENKPSSVTKISRSDGIEKLTDFGEEKVQGGKDI